MNTHDDAFSNTFLQLNTTTREGYRVLLFSTDIALNACNYSTVHIIYADGTFKVAPPQFTQLWVISGHFSHNTVLLIAYALLENKRATSYLTVVEFISHRCPNLNPVTVVLDFEKHGSARPPPLRGALPPPLDFKCPPLSFSKGAGVPTFVNSVRILSKCTFQNLVIRPRKSLLFDI